MRLPSFARIIEYVTSINTHIHIFKSCFLSDSFVVVHKLCKNNKNIAKLEIMVILGHMPCHVRIKTISTQQTSSIPHLYFLSDISILSICLIYNRFDAIVSSYSIKTMSQYLVYSKRNGLILYFYAFRFKKCIIFFRI